MRELSPLRNPLGKQGSACVEVMTTLHGSTRFLGGVQRVAYCQIAYVRDPLTHPFYLIEPPQPCRLA